MDIIKYEVECFCKLFPLLIQNAEELFCLPDELIATLESSLEKQVEDNNFHDCFSVFFLH